MGTKGRYLLFFAFICLVTVVYIVLVSSWLNSSMRDFSLCVGDTWP